MKMLVITSILLTSFGFGLSACQSDQHTMADTADTAAGKAPVCQECYDAVTAARSTHPANDASRNETIQTYQCPCCKTEMSVYIENGIHMVKCGGCASEGVAWDECRPTEMPPQ